MKVRWIFLCALLVPGLVSAADGPGQFPAGLVYGPKAVFQISAPTGWVLDNHSGLPQGLNCVLYPVGGAWPGSPVTMYAKIASPEYPKKDKFLSFTADYFRNDDPNFQQRVVEEGRTVEGFEFTIKDYDRPSYPLFERVFYVQLPAAVAYVVLRTPSPQQRASAVKYMNELVRSFRYRPELIAK